MADNVFFGGDPDRANRHLEMFEREKNWSAELVRPLVEHGDEIERMLEVLERPLARIQGRRGRLVEVAK